MAMAITVDRLPAMSSPAPTVHLVVNLPNIIGGMRDTFRVAEPTDLPACAVHLEGPALHRFMHLNRPVGSAVWAGTRREATARTFEKVHGLRPTPLVSQAGFDGD
jgi:hypothetical protein